jgi:hypothetical protein
MTQIMAVTGHKSALSVAISIIKMLTISKNLVWPRDFESFKGGNFNTLSLVDCYVQICNGTAVEHGSLLNCYIEQDFPL